MNFKIVVLCSVFLFVLTGCTNNGFKQSGRTLPEIMEDAKNGVYDKAIDMKQIIATDRCDCMALIDWKEVDEEAEKIKAIQSKGKEAIPMVDYRLDVVLGANMIISACKQMFIEISYSDYRKMPDDFALIDTLVTQTCPEIESLFNKYSEQN